MVLTAGVSDVLSRVGMQKKYDNTYQKYDDFGWDALIAAATVPPLVCCAAACCHQLTQNMMTTMINMRMTTACAVWLVCCHESI